MVGGSFTAGAAAMAIGPRVNVEQWAPVIAGQFDWSAGKLKGHKSSLYDGGIRVPGIVSWPARVPAGQVIDEPVAGMDVFPTIMAAAGADVGEIELDGKSLLPVLIERAPSPREAIYW